MKKTIALVLSTVALLGMAAPVLAGPFGNGDSDDRDFAATRILNTLQQRGVPATAVEEWGDYVRAFVKHDNGSQTMMFFDPITLERVQP
jgi:hypothetical protein